MSSKNKPVSSPALTATGGQELSIEDFRGHPLVIYFYPRDNTPGCTRQGQDFRDRHDDFQAVGCAVLGVSRDSLKSHEKFAEKQGFPFPLIADEDELLCRQFDVIREKNMYGRKVMGIERSTFLLDAEGCIVKSWRKVRVPGHVDEVLEAARELAG